MNRKTNANIARSLMLLFAVVFFTACATQGVAVSGKVFTHPEPGEYTSTIWMDQASPILSRGTMLNGAHVEVSYMGPSGKRHFANASTDPEGGFDIRLPVERSPSERMIDVTLEAEMDGYIPVTKKFKYGSSTIPKTALIFLRKKP